MPIRKAYAFLPSRQNTREIPADLAEFCETVTLDDGTPFTFQGREYLKEIAADDSKQICIIKGRQTGITSLIILKIIHTAIMNPRLRLVYVTDTWDHAAKFTQDRLDPVLESLGLARHVSDKKISRVRFPNGSLLYVTSAYSKFKQARSIKADYVYLDECQNSELDALANLRESMAQSKHGRIIIAGTGDWEGSQWHRFYSGKTTCAEWDGSKWVKYGEGHNGYHISQELMPNISPQELEQKRKEYTAATFQMEVLGEFATGAKIPLPHSMAIKAYSESLHLMAPGQIDRQAGKLYATVDWAGGGGAFTVLTITQEREDRLQVVHLERFNDSDVLGLGKKVSDRITEYNPDQVFCDIGGNQGALQILENNHAVQKVGLGEHPGDPIKVHSDRDLITVDKSTYLQRVISWFEEDKITIPLNESTEWSIDHLTAEEARTITKTTGGTVLRFSLMPHRNDDFLMSLVFLAVALDPASPGQFVHYSAIV